MGEEDRGDAAGGFLDDGEDEGGGWRGRGVAYADAGEDGARGEEAGDAAGECLEGVLGCLSVE